MDKSHQLPLKERELPKIMVIRKKTCMTCFRSAYTVDEKLLTHPAATVAPVIA